MAQYDLEKLKNSALQIRKDILHITNAAKCGHPGGSLSAVEIMVALYGYKMRVKADDPKWEDRDRLIVSKGHVSPVVYTSLCEYGFFPREELKGYRTFQSRLQGHVHQKVPGVDFNTGSLGHGLSVANGIAYGAQMRKKDINVYCIMGDGEIQEGSVWEAAMTASHHNIDQVCAIVDYNKVQENGRCEDIKSLEPLVDKWKSFGWEVADVDGHDIEAMIAALDKFDTIKGKPYVILANTIKGKGVSFMEGKNQWHGKAPNDEQLAEALSELK